MNGSARAPQAQSAQAFGGQREGASRFDDEIASAELRRHLFGVDAGQVDLHDDTRLGDEDVGERVAGSRAHPAASHELFEALLDPLAR